MRARERLYFLSLVLQLAVAPFLVHDWDGFVFTRAVRDFLHGMTPYAVAEVDPAYIHVSNSWPPLNTWFAYPPLALLFMTPSLAIAIGSSAPAWLMRIALKAPFIVGTLVLAAVGAQLLRAWGKEDGARSWERMVLFNPFLLFVSAAWGMFDAWMVALLLLSVLFLERGRIALAGVAFGASALIKLFPLFAAPAFFLYVARRAPHRARDALRFAGAAAGTFALVSLPFFAPHPRGFLLQVLRMHIERPPQGLSLPALYVEAGRFAAAQGWIAGEPNVRLLSALTFGATIGVTVFTTVVAARARSSATLVRSSLGLFLGVLYTSKVLNEQYFVIPVALYALVACTTGHLWARQGYRMFSAGALVASLLLGWHFVTFWPADVTEPLFGKRNYAIVADIATLSGVRPSTFIFVPTALAFLALLPATIASVRRIARECRAGARLLTTVVARRLRLGKAWARTAVAMAAVAPVFVQTAAMGRERDEDLPPLSSTDRHVGVFYYLWWANPSRDPAKVDGNWRDGVSERPAEGYYTVSAVKLRNDFRLARSHGIDLVITSFHEYDVPLLPAALRAAYDQDVAMAPLIELGDIYAKPEFRSVDDGFTLQPATAEAIVELASKALAPFARAPAAYRPGGKLAVFLYDSYFFGGDWRPVAIERLRDRVEAIAVEEAQVEHTPAPSRSDLDRSKPTSFQAMLEDVRYGHLWRRAYVEAFHDFWRRIREALERRFGPLELFSGESWNAGAPFHRGAQTALDGMHVFDATFMYSPSFVSVLHRKDSYERNWERWVVRSTLQAQYERGAGRPVIATVIPAYDDRVARRSRGFEIPADGPRGDTYDLMWRFGLGLSPDLVLITSWNEFFEGTAIEPTVEHGDSFLRRTLEWSRRAHVVAPPAKRGLILTGEASSHYAPGIVDPSVEGRYAHNLQTVAERDLSHFSFDALDVSSPEAAGRDLARYQLLMVEPGLDDRSPTVDALVARVAAWVKGGGHLLLSGVSTGSSWEALSGAHAGAPTESATRVVALDGTLLDLPPATRPMRADLPDGAEVLLRYGDGDASDLPAAWSLHVGSGTVVATAMHLTGRDKYPVDDAGALFCACVRPLLAAGDACGNSRRETVP